MFSRFQRSARGLLAALGLFALVFAPSARATTMLFSDLPQLVQKSDAVVRGTVKSVRSRWSSDRSRIVTDVELEVAESLKGSPGSSLLILQPGGVVGEVGQQISGLPSFVEGEEVVVFLERRGTSAFRVRGMAQGKYRVERSSDGSATVVPELLGDTRVLDPLTRKEVVVTRAPMPLEQLKLKIFDALRATTPDDSSPDKPVLVPGDPR